MSYDQFAKFFTEADADNSGLLDIDELIKRLRKGGYKGTEEQIKNAFSEADTSGDGQISFEEYMIAMGFKLRKNHKGMALYRCFLEFDPKKSWTFELKVLPGIMFTSIRKYFEGAELHKMSEVAEKMQDSRGLIDYAKLLRELARIDMIALEGIPFPKEAVGKPEAMIRPATASTTSAAPRARAKRQVDVVAAKPKPAMGAARAANNCSAHAAWMVIRNNSSFLVKRNGLNLSREPNNLRNLNSFRFNGLVHQQAVGIQPASDGKGVVLVTKNKKAFRKPSSGNNRTELKKGSRRTLQSIRKTLGKGRYRKDLTMAALRRASALIRSQKPVAAKKAGGRSRRRKD